MTNRYIVAACRCSESLNDPHFPISVMIIGAESRGTLSVDDAALIPALASALPGMGKDSERLAKLAAMVGSKDDRGVVTLGWQNGSCCVFDGRDGDFQDTVGFGDDLAVALDDVELEFEDDDNAAAARAAQPEETP